MSYAQIVDFRRYYERFATLYYGDSENLAATAEISTTEMQSDIDASFNKLNTILDSFNRIPIVPIGTNLKTGSYHPYLIELNACDTIYTKLRARHQSEHSAGLPDWMTSFGSRCEWILSQIAQGGIALDTDTTNRGIGYPMIMVGSGVATIFSNWDSGFYDGSEYPKEYRLKIIDTTAVGSNVGQAYFTVSADGGASFETATRTTGTDWQDIEDGFKVRWYPAATLGTNTQHVVGDEWKVDCIPVNVQHISQPSKYSTFKRG